ncbi:Yip1-domain-containing protein [Microthyrium microscopicum]|uniref:Protein YIP n=1 Tax=Microthyrium microscopicum TaxID=703497 RepID=A0A6A6U4S7_9PEZI|nr:Yip1-domain-containing protein [Microthyrium microscopicum]
MAQYGYPPQQQATPNLQFYQSSYSQQPVSGHSTPFQAYNNAGASSSGYANTGFGGGFGAQPGVSGRMGDQGGLRTGWLAAFGTEGYDGEPPLLEELGVNFGHIKMKTLSVLNPLARMDQHIMDDADLAGPVLFFLLFGFFLLFSGKVHFGYIYGLGALGSLSLWGVFSLMAPPTVSDASSTQHEHPSNLLSTLTFGRSTSVLGYCILPLVFTSLVGIAVPMDTFFGYIITSLAISWCTYSSSAMFCAVGRMSQMRVLVAYPLALFYGLFGIMAIFSSRGSGVLEAKATAGHPI